jgi:hypothetical protein
MKASRSADQLVVSLVIAAADSPALRPEELRERRHEVLGRQPVQVQKRQHLGHLRGAPCVRRQDHALEPTPLPGVLVDPAIVHPRCLNPECAGSRDQAPGSGVAVSHHQGVAALVPGVAVSLQVGVHLGLERDRQHPLGTQATDLIQGEGELLASVLVCDYPEHRRTSSRRRCRAGSSDQRSTGGYATPITRSRIHNFRSYLRADLDDDDPGLLDELVQEWAVEAFDAFDAAYGRAGVARCGNPSGLYEHWGLKSYELAGRGYIIDWGENRDEVRAWASWPLAGGDEAFEGAVIEAWAAACSTIGLPPFLGECWDGNPPLIFQSVESLVRSSEEGRNCGTGFAISTRISEGRFRIGRSSGYQPSTRHGRPSSSPRSRRSR